MRKIVTSNINYTDHNTLNVNYNDYIKQGWYHFDNATIMLLRLLVKVGIGRVVFAGFDGYIQNKDNYATASMELIRDSETIERLNADTKEMLEDVVTHCDIPVDFITDSLYRDVCK